MITFGDLQFAERHFRQKFVFVRVQGCRYGSSIRPVSKLVQFKRVQLNYPYTYVLGFLIVPVLFLILAITIMSLNRNNPRSFLVVCPENMDTTSKSRNVRSPCTKSVIPSMTTSNSRSVASRWPFSSASRSLQFRCIKIVCTNRFASCNRLWSGWLLSVCLISLDRISS